MKIKVVSTIEKPKQLQVVNSGPIRIRPEIRVINITLKEKPYAQHASH